MEKYDLKKEFKNVYAGPAGKPVIVDVPDFYYLMIDGEGNPNTSPRFKTAVESLYTAAYSIKAMCKKNYNSDFVVQPLEGLWYSADMKNFSVNRKEEWSWTLMINMPGFVTAGNFSKGIEAASAKKKGLPFEEIRFEKYSEGKSVQILYQGPYSAEEGAIALMHRFALDNGFALHKKHHEIYLSNPDKIPQNELKTILRNPIK